MNIRHLLAVTLVIFLGTQTCWGAAEEEMHAVSSSEYSDSEVVFEDDPASDDEPKESYGRTSKLLEAMHAYDQKKFTKNLTQNNKNATFPHGINRMPLLFITINLNCPAMTMAVLKMGVDVNKPCNISQDNRVRYQTPLEYTLMHNKLYNDQFTPVIAQLIDLGAKIPEAAHNRRELVRSGFAEEVARLELGR